MKTRKINWGMFEEAMDILIEKIKPHNHEIKWLVAVTRDGLIPAGFLAERLAITDIDTLGAKAYDDTKQRKLVHLFKLPRYEVVNAGVQTLVVDAICDSGATFQRIKEILPYAMYSTVYLRSSSEFLPSFYALTIEDDDWLQFPWEQNKRS